MKKKLILSEKLVVIIAVLAIGFAVYTGNAYAADKSNGTVKDGKLAWLKNANCFERLTWDQATSNAKTLKSGMCGLTDGSKAGDWRVPTIQELQTRIGNTRGFSNVQTYFYWSSSDYTSFANSVYVVDMGAGNVNGFSKTGSVYTWPVRDAK